MPVQAACLRPVDARIVLPSSRLAPALAAVSTIVDARIGSLRQPQDIRGERRPTRGRRTPPDRSLGPDATLGVELIPRIGVDNVMWASDYPHGDSTWPHSRKALAESSLALHGPDVLRKVTCENAARVYGFRV